MSNRRLIDSSSFRYPEQNPDYMGQKLNESYINGPAQDRKCTDILCCILFLILIAGMGFVAYIGFKTGDPRYLASPFDEDGKQCKYDHPGYDKIYISYFTKNISDISFVCVKECPTNSDPILDCKTTSYVKQCSQLKVYSSDTVVNLCYPNQSSVFDQFNFDQFMDITVLQEYFADLQHGWPLILGIVGVSLLLSLFFTVFIRCFAGCFVWSMILLLMLLLLAVGFIAFFIGDVSFLQEIFHYNDFPENLKDTQYQKIVGIVCWVLFLIVFLVVCCSRTEIQRSIAILKAAADFTRQQCSALLIPIFIVIFQIIFLAIWMTCILFIFSSNETDVQPIKRTPFAFVEWNQNIQNYTILYVFGLLWIIYFFEALGAYWSASTVAIWYFQEGKPSHPIIKSIKRSFLQVGSLAFGALLVSVVMFIRILLEVITKKLKTSSLGMQEQAAPAKFALKCASCCIACFQRIVRFLTENAYIMMAISGENFCSSAKQSFYLMLRCTVQFAISHGTTKFFVGIGKLLIVVLCCFIGYIALTQIPEYRQKIYSPVFLTILFGIAAYPIASAFLSLFQMAANAILMCYCVQLDLMKGNNPKCPAGLRNFLRQYNPSDNDSQY